MAGNATPEQQAAIEKSGKVIVSASAGSGKTFVMIQRLADFIERGGDLDCVLAVTFTKKAAAQMKEKLRSELIKRSASEDGAVRAHIKQQLGKISSANISTIHSFCGYLLRVYFYLIDIDGSFEVVSEDGGADFFRDSDPDRASDDGTRRSAGGNGYTASRRNPAADGCGHRRFRQSVQSERQGWRKRRYQRNGQSGQRVE